MIAKHMEGMFSLFLATGMACGLILGFAVGLQVGRTK